MENRKGGDGGGFHLKWWGRGGGFPNPDPRRIASPNAPMTLSKLVPMSNDEIELYEETVAQEQNVLQQGLVTLRTLKGQDANEQIRRLEAGIKKFNKTLGSYRIHVKNIKDPVKKATYDRKLKEHEQDLANHEAELRSLKAELVDNGGATAGPSVDPGSVEERMQTTQGVLKVTTEIQDKSLASLQHTAQMAAQNEEVAANTNMQLRIQTEKLEQANNELNVLEMELKRAKRDMVWFLRNAATDKCLVALFGLIVCAIVFIIVWAIWGPKQDDKNTPKPFWEVLNKTDGTYAPRRAALGPQRM